MSFDKGMDKRRRGNIYTGILRVKVKVAQSCSTLCYPMDYIVHGILQARILEWVAVPLVQCKNPDSMKGRELLDNTDQ